MNRVQKFQEVVGHYRRHGWQPARVLMSTETLEELRAAGAGAAGATPLFENIAVQESEVDAMWFTRPSQGGRDAWELRLVGDAPYALFELFEPDEAEEDREDVRREMESRLRDYATGKNDER